MQNGLNVNKKLTKEELDYIFGEGLKKEGFDNMDFIHSREYLHQGDVVVVDCSHQCNILLTDDNNFQKYKRGDSFRYFGGAYKMFPARITVPETGNWNVTIDLGGGQANIRYNISFIKNT